jgi:hypothetical protein
VINAIQSNEYFRSFSSATFDECKNNYPKRNVYVEGNNDIFFISLDMKKANFSALRHWNENIFNGCQSWEEFLSQYTNSNHILNSKYIRQVIMGACNPKRQIKYEHLLMSNLLDMILQEVSEIFSVYSLSSDEIILMPFEQEGTCPCKKHAQCIKIIQNILEKSEISSIIRVTAYMLEKVKGTDGWIKYTTYTKYTDEEYINMDISFKCLDSEIYNQVIKHYLGKAITYNDLVFYHNNRLARFIKPIENPWK